MTDRRDLRSLRAPACGVAAFLLLAELLPSCSVEPASSSTLPARVTRPTAPSAPSELAEPSKPEPRRSEELVVVAGGDVNLGRGVGRRLLEDPDYDPFAGVRSLFESADVAFANLESPLSHQAGQTRHPTLANIFTGPPSGADALARAGIDVVSIANNHAWDYGFEGFTQTLDHLGLFAIAAAGGSARRGQQYEPAVVRKKGWSVALLAVTAAWNSGDFSKHEAREHVAWADAARLEAAVEKARREHDLVLVSYHGGREYSMLPTGDTRYVTRSAIERGADAVLGHHPHVPQGVEWIGDKPVFYSLGNLVFGVHRDHLWTGRGYLARIVFSARRPPVVSACPFFIEKDLPRLPTDEEWAELGEYLTGYLEQTSERYGAAQAGERDGAGCFAVARGER